MSPDENVRKEEFQVMTASTNPLAKFFGVFLDGQSYLNALYVFLAFPLGLFYFIFLVVGLSLGISLLILWVGILILLVVLGGWWAFAAFERQMAIWLLHEDIPPMPRPGAQPQGTWAQFVGYLTNPVTWKSLVYLLVKFPLGILSFVVAVTLLALTGAFLTAPLSFAFFPMQIQLIGNQVYSIDTPLEAGLAFLVGLILALVSLHILNGLAWISGRFAYLMLGYFPAAKRPSALAQKTALAQNTAPETPVSAAPVLPIAPAQPFAPAQSSEPLPVEPAEPEQPVTPEPSAEAIDFEQERNTL